MITTMVFTLKLHKTHKVVIISRKSVRVKIKQGLEKRNLRGQIKEILLTQE